MEIRIAQTATEFAAVRNLRFEINFHELGKDYLFENEEKIDQVSVILIAENEGEIVGTVRCQFCHYDKHKMAYWGLSFPSSRSKIALVDRLAVLPQFRNSRAAYHLVNQIYKQALLEGSYLALMECEHHLLPFYEHMGFKVFREVTHSYGPRYQLYINPWNASHLAAVRSPFLGEYNRYQEEVNEFILTQNQVV